MTVKKANKCFSGKVEFCEHESEATKSKMNYSVFTPDEGVKIKGALIWLSGLTCSEENFQAKAGAQKALSEAGLQVFCPDTSPRGFNLPNEHESWDFGSAASFYVDALTPGYKDNYRMYSYIADEFYTLVKNQAKVPISIFGHSMGGHGALMIGLREPAKFKSISAFSPIVNPIACPWGQKAFAGYFGADKQDLWKQHDTCELLKAGKKHPVSLLVDQGTDDQFLEKELLTDHLVKTCKETGQKAEIRMQKGYDHSYYFISTFVRDHIQFHASHM